MKIYKSLGYSQIKIIDTPKDYFLTICSKEELDLLHDCVYARDISGKKYQILEEELQKALEGQEEE